MNRVGCVAASRHANPVSLSHLILLSSLTPLNPLSPTPLTSSPFSVCGISNTLLQRVLFVLCAANELFFLCLYLMAFYTRPLGLNIASIFPSALFDWVTADKMSWQFKLVYETIPSLTWPQIVGAISFPMCAVKQVINGVQFWKAAKVLADMDVQDRSRRRM